jgi:hypothetical protein
MRADAGVMETVQELRDCVFDLDDSLCHSSPSLEGQVGTMRLLNFGQDYDSLPTVDNECPRLSM